MKSTPSRNSDTYETDRAPPSSGDTNIGSGHNSRRDPDPDPDPGPDPDPDPDPDASGIWHAFVPLGLVTAEIGVLFDLTPIAVGGLVLFARSIAGVLVEMRFARGPVYLLTGIGLLYALAGSGLVYAFGGSTGAFELGFRGIALAVAGGVTTALAAWRWFETETSAGPGVGS